MKDQGPFCYVNGQRHNLPGASAELTLLEYLRGLQLDWPPVLLGEVGKALSEGYVMAAESGLTGTKLGCGEGVCGSCTVMVSDVQCGELQHQSVNACLFPLYAADGKHIITVEGGLVHCTIACI